MKRLNALGASLICVLATGCYGEDTQAAEKQGMATDSEAVEKEVQEAWTAVKAYAYDRRAEVQSELESQLSEWGDDIDELKAEAKTLTGDAKDELQSRIDELKQTREEIATKIDELQTSTRAAWSEIRDGAVDSMERMEQALEDASSAVVSDEEDESGGY